MPLFTPTLDTLRWDDLVRQGRAQLPIVSPAWTDENTSDPGIALLELIAWIVETDSFRSNAVSDRERRRLLSLAGFSARASRPATCLVGFRTAAPRRIPAGLRLDGERDGQGLPLTLVSDVAVVGARIDAVAWATAGAHADDYRSGCSDETRERTAGRAIRPFGHDPAAGDAFILGLDRATGLPAGALDLWFVAPDGPLSADLLPAESSAGAVHHGVRTAWDVWDGAQWRALPAADVHDGTAALARSGRVRLAVPALPRTPLGDPVTGAFAGRSLAWLRCRIDSGRHDAPPVLAGVHVDAGEAVVARPYESAWRLPGGTPVTGAPTPGGAFDSAAVALRLAGDGAPLSLGLEPATESSADPAPRDEWPVEPHEPDLAPPPPPSVPCVDVVRWDAASGTLVIAAAVLGTAAGVPHETLRLPEPWCGRPPRLWAVRPDATLAAVRVVDDLAEASASDLACALDDDGRTVRFGDGRNGRLLPAGATVLARGWSTTPTGLAAIRPPVAVSVPRDERALALLGADAATTAAEVLVGLRPGAPREDVPELAARAEAALWVHDRIAETARRRGASSLDDLPLADVRRLGVPERSVTALDFERRALGTPGVSLWRARALPDVDPRLPGLRADGCVTVVAVPPLPLARPEPTPAALARVRAELVGTRTVGTRVFVVGPTYVRVGVRATLVLRPDAVPGRTRDAAARALRAFLHPVTGGSSGRGWPFGRTVRRSEVLQLLDALDGIDRVERLVLTRELADGSGCRECGDVDLGATALALAGDLELTTEGGAWT